MKRFIVTLFGRQLQPVLIVCFSLVAALTVGLSAVVTLSVIIDYLDQAMNSRVARDMDLAKAFYQLKLDEIAAVAERVVRDPGVAQSLPAALTGDDEARVLIYQEMSRKMSIPSLGGTHLILLLDPAGNIIFGRVSTPDGELSTPITQGYWGNLPIVSASLTSEKPLAATEIIPAEFLAMLGIEDKARITIIETPLETVVPYDSREGTAGLALASVYPFVNNQGEVTGAIATAYLFNNDFTFVDRVKEVAGVDTVTVFFGDLRVSTNVMTEQGERAVGTRLSKEVFDVVLTRGSNYVGRAFVVNDWFITRYEPLLDYRGRVVGSLYVGARESTFRTLVQNFNYRVIFIALAGMIVAGIVAVPIARLITRPITALVEANRGLAQGDMSVRVQPYGTGELAELGHSFNKLAETLDSTQKELLRKERLASMGQLAAGVAHEINNPLGTILLFSEMMYKETEPGDAGHSDLRMIIDETYRCKNIVADLLNFARQQEVLAQDVDLNELICRVVDLSNLRPAFEKVAFVRQCAPDLPTIHADPAQLEQVFVNLFNNAAEAFSDGGTITISTRAIAAGFVEIRIADTGCGIPEENLSKLFTPFFTTKSVGKGTGLGLSIVYGIIKMHKGQITAQSEVGRGTTFTIILPVQTGEREVLIGERAGA